MTKKHRRRAPNRPSPRRRGAWVDPIGSFYSDADIQLIANRVGVAVEKVEAGRRELNKAAFWYQLDRRKAQTSLRTEPGVQLERLRKMRHGARVMLTALQVDRDTAADGPADIDLLATLAPNGDEDAVVEDTAAIGDLDKVLSGILAAAAIDRRAAKAQDNVKRVGDLTVPKGYTGDLALNAWIGRLMQIYQAVTGRKPGTSTGSGKAGGPLIRFVTAAGRPLDISISPGKLRGRIRARTAKSSP